MIMVGRYLPRNHHCIYTLDVFGIFLIMGQWLLKMLLFVALLCLFALSGGQIPDEWVLNFDSPVYVCPDDDSLAWIDTSKVELIRFNETTAFLTGDVNFLKGLQERTMVQLRVEKESYGRYELALSHEICDLCAEIGNLESDYREYLKFFGFPEKCPFKESEYHIHDFIADTTDFPVNSQNSGRYQVIINFLSTNEDGCSDNDKQFIACVKLDFVIEPL